MPMRCTTSLNSRPSRSISGKTMQKQVPNNSLRTFHPTRCPRLSLMVRKYRFSITTQYLTMTMKILKRLLSLREKILTRNITMNCCSRNKFHQWVHTRSWERSGWRSLRSISWHSRGTQALQGIAIAVQVRVKGGRSLVLKIVLAKHVVFAPQMALGEGMDHHFHPTPALPRPTRLVWDTMGPNLRLQANSLTRSRPRTIWEVTPPIISATCIQRPCRARWWRVSRRKRWRSETLSRKGRATWSWSIMTYRGSRAGRKSSTKQTPSSGRKIRTQAHNLRISALHSSLNRGLISFRWCHQRWATARKGCTIFLGLRVAPIKVNSLKTGLETWSLQT